MVKRIKAKNNIGFLYVKNFQFYLMSAQNWKKIFIINEFIDCSPKFNGKYYEG